MKKGILALGLLSVVALAGCSNSIKVNPDKEEYVVGVAQYDTHPALDAATEGFTTKLTEILTAKGRKVSYQLKNASGEGSLVTTVVSDLVAKDVDLIMANATPCLTAAYTATSTIPVLGTSITDYGAALNMEFKDGKSGINVSGTSDLAPLDQQADELVKLLPNAKKVGIVYCSSEANSKFQVDEMKKHLSAKNITVNAHPFNDTSDLTAVCQKAAADNDAIYVPTDNTAAKYASVINSVFLGAHKPVYAGESGICKTAGVATLSIDYFRLGQVTAEMAAKVLLGEEDIREMKVGYDKGVTKLYSKSHCDAFGIEVPSDYVMIEE